MATFVSTASQDNSRLDGLTFGACTIAVLCAMTDVKVFDLQLLELFMLVYLPFFLAVWRFRIVLLPPFSVMGRRTLLFFILMLLGAVASLRLDFFPPANFGILKIPPYASFVRLGQVVLSFSTFFVVGIVASRDRVSLEKVVAAFIWGGLLSSAWAIVSVAAYFAGIEIPGAYVYGGVLRARGFFVEGGPFGVYLVGTVAALLTRYFYLRSINTRTLILQGTIIFIALALSQSKASIVVASVLLIVYMYAAGRVGFVLAAALALAPVAVAADFGNRVSAYYEASSNLQREIRLRPEDRNYIMGRLAASVILPRMVEEFPILGIGIGNYSLKRNDPEILRGMPQVREWDLHGMGLFGYMAELGIPLTLYLLTLYAYPFLLALRSRVRNLGWLATLGVFPICATLFGAQITFSYPWLIAGLVVAMVCLRFKANHQRPFSQQTALL